jgi:hypothetical protein
MALPNAVNKLMKFPSSINLKQTNWTLKIERQANAPNSWCAYAVTIRQNAMRVNFVGEVGNLGENGYALAQVMESRPIKNAVGSKRSRVIAVGKDPILIMIVKVGAGFVENKAGSRIDLKIGDEGKLVSL